MASAGKRSRTPTDEVGWLLDRIGGFDIPTRPQMVELGRRMWLAQMARHRLEPPPAPRRCSGQGPAGPCRRYAMRGTSACYAHATSWAQELPNTRAGLQAMIRDGEQARWEMVLGNLRLAAKMGLRMAQSMSLDPADAIQEAIFGLVKAVDHYDWQRPTSFATMAVWWILQSLQRGSGMRDITAVPAGVRQQIAAIRRAVSHDPELAGGSLSTQAIERYRSSASADMVRAARFVMASPLQLDAPAGPDTDTTLHELIPSPGDDWQNWGEQADLRRALVDLLKEFDAVTQKIVVAHYGILGQDEMPKSGIALALDLSVGEVERRLKAFRARAREWARTYTPQWNDGV